MLDVGKEHFGFRLDSAERARITEQASTYSVSESELARRYVTEGLRVDRHPAIKFRGGAGGRRAVLTVRPRLAIADVIETWELEDRDVAATAAYFELPPADVTAAIGYYADFPEEIDGYLREKRLAADRLERVFRRRPVRR